MQEILHKMLNRHENPYEKIWDQYHTCRSRVKMTYACMKYHNHTHQTNQWYREEETQKTNSHMAASTQLI